MISRPNNITFSEDFDTLYYRLYHLVRHKYNPKTNPMLSAPPIDNLTQIKTGLLLPSQGLCKGFRKTFTKYKSLYHLIYDSMQPIRGGINIIEGIVHLTVGTGRLPILPIQYAISAISTMSCFDNPNKTLEDVNGYYRRLFSFSLSWILYGLTNSIRGITQIVTTPLTFAIKMPLRIFITLGAGIGRIYRILKGGKLPANNSFNNTSIGNNGPPQRRSSDDFYQQSIPTNKTDTDPQTSTHIILSGINWFTQGFAKRLSFKYFKPKKTRKDEEKQTPRINHYFPYQRHY